jgi:hypothetical protein
MKLKTSIVLKVQENSYEIKHPTIGQLIDIELLKAQITNGNYGKMVGNLSQSSILSLDMVDTFAHFRIMCPNLLNDLTVENWGDLGSLDSLDLFEAYVKQFKPWYDEFSTHLLERWQSITDSIKSDNQTNGEDNPQTSAGEKAS